MTPEELAELERQLWYQDRAFVKGLLCGIFGTAILGLIISFF
jgi:hypothetical protein